MPWLVILLLYTQLAHEHMSVAGYPVHVLATHFGDSPGVRKVWSWYVELNPWCFPTSISILEVPHFVLPDSFRFSCQVFKDTCSRNDSYVNAAFNLPYTVGISLDHCQLILHVIHTTGPCDCWLTLSPCTDTYTHTDSPLQISILGLFCQLQYRWVV